MSPGWVTFVIELSVPWRLYWLQWPASLEPIASGIRGAAAGEPAGRSEVLRMLGTPLETGKMVRPESAPKIRVLIVERHMAVRRALRKRLSATADLDVLAAVQDPAAALSYLEHDGNGTAGPDVILLGLQSGSDEELFATLEIVHQMTRCPAAVIVLAPYADEVERLLLQQAGASRYLLKHIDSYRLIQEIQAAAPQGRNAVPTS
jgi:CheY-like chemotaxis protein